MLLKSLVMMINGFQQCMKTFVGLSQGAIEQCSQTSWQDSLFYRYVLHVLDM